MPKSPLVVDLLQGLSGALHERIAHLRPRMAIHPTTPTTTMTSRIIRSCRSSCCHGPAGDSAELAGLCAMFAVAHLILCAFGTAGLAGCGAKGAYCLDVFPAPADGRRGEAANVGTFQIQRDAPDHSLWVCLLQAGGCTLEASRSALIARTEAIDFFLAEHLCFLDGLPVMRSPIIKTIK